MKKKTSKTRQQKRRERYAKDRRNTYGEHANGSRKNIPRKKRRQNRSERRIVNQAAARTAVLDPATIDAAGAKVRQKQKSVSRLEFPDEPLAGVVAEKLRRRADTGQITAAAAR